MKITGRYRCCECGHVFTDDEIKEVEEYRGEYWGAPAYETMYYSPCCTSDFDEIELDPNKLWKCKDCHKIYDSSDIGVDDEIDDRDIKEHLYCPDCNGDVEEFVEV